MGVNLIAPDDTVAPDHPLPPRERLPGNGGPGIDSPREPPGAEGLTRIDDRRKGDRAGRVQRSGALRERIGVMEWQRRIFEDGLHGVWRESGPVIRATGVEHGRDDAADDRR